MLTFREGWRSFKEGLDWRFIREYWSAVWNHAWEIFWGAGVIGVAFTIYTLYHSPPWALLGWAVALGFLVAGYAAWRSDHVRLIPKFEVKEYVIQPTETENPKVTNVFIQIIPECTTESPVRECRGRLLLVSKRDSDEDEWTATQLNSPLFLGWDYYGHGPFTLEPGIKQRLNVCWWSSESRLIIPSVDPLPSKFRVVFGSGRIFKFDIRITAKDCSPADVSVTVRLDGREWDKPLIELLKGH